MPHKASAVANFFLLKARQEAMPITQLKLMKLVYIAHGWHLALLGTPLLNEPIEAWRHGPVIPSLYHEFKHFGKTPIDTLATEYDFFEDESPQTPLLENTTTEFKDTLWVLEKVWGVYKKFPATVLRKITHEDEPSWQQAYQGDYVNAVIENDSIHAHFKQLLEALVKP
ncbi:MAG: type II toxin-antitoxin system antitoxin SocA domain-containing protein [Vampirovibrionales bacterium]|nr:type II toxin-antitoxin system antitoxin SocA domain-containing protein [Vampirovibrionales bacterium]